MLRTALCLGMVFLAGCGGSDFDGKWNGSVVTTGSCEAGDFFGGSGSGDITLETSGMELTFKYIPCGKDALADISGDTATLRVTTCREASAGDTSRQTLQISGGTLTLLPDKSLSVVIKELTSNPKNGGTCNLVNTGVFNKAE